MLKTLAIIGVVIVVAIAGILLYAATKPDSFRVQRTVLINAPPDKIFPLINDIKAWTAWSPYEKKDPAMKRTLRCCHCWQRRHLCLGRRQECRPGQHGDHRERPAQDRDQARFPETLRGPQHGRVHCWSRKATAPSVTWAIYGPSPYMSKVIGTFMNIDDMIGRDFEKGLADLKAAAEKK